MILASAYLTLLATVSSVNLPVADQFKGVYYKSPKNWTISDDADVRSLSADGLSEGQFLTIMITAPEKASLDPISKHFDDSVKVVTEDCKVKAKGEITEMKRDSGKMLLQALAVDHESAGSHTRMVGLLVEDGKQSLFLILVKPDSLLEKHSESVQAFLSSFSMKPLPKESPVKQSSLKVPLGETPLEIMGSVGWRPSGRGMVMPSAASFVDGKPHGLWYGTSVDNSQNLIPTAIYFTSDGIRATNPRLGGGLLFDIEGQRAQAGATGVGNYSIANGEMVQKYDGFTKAGVYSIVKGERGISFKIDEAIFRSMVMLTKSSLVGKWRSRGSQLIFKEDGTYQSGQILDSGEWAVGSLSSGRYLIDGFILMLEPEDGPIQLDRAGMGGVMMIKGGRFYTKY